MEIHPHALAAAEASEAAAAQGRFWPMHGALFQRQKALERADLECYANEIGSASSGFGKSHACRCFSAGGSTRWRR